jgi:hypothetical protein
MHGNFAEARAKGQAGSLLPARGHRKRSRANAELQGGSAARLGEANCVKAALNISSFPAD